MGSTLPFEICIGGISVLVSLAAAILLGTVKSPHVWPHENWRPLAIINIVLTIAADVYLNFAIARIVKNGRSHMLNKRMHPLAHCAVSLMNLAFSLGIMLSKPYNNELDRYYFDGPEFYFPTGPVELDCCLFWALTGLHLFNFMAVLVNRSRRQTFKDMYGYDGYNDPKSSGDVSLDSVGDDGQPRPATPKRVYEV